MKMTQHWLMEVPYLPENYGNCAVKQRFRGSPAADHRVTWVRRHVAAFTTIARYPDNLCAGVPAPIQPPSSQEVFLIARNIVPLLQMIGDDWFLQGRRQSTNVSSSIYRDDEQILTIDAQRPSRDGDQNAFANSSTCFRRRVAKCLPGKVRQGVAHSDGYSVRETFQGIFLKTQNCMLWVGGAYKITLMWIAWTHLNLQKGRNISIGLQIKENIPKKSTAQKSSIFWVVE